MSETLLLDLIKVLFGALAGGLTNTIAVWMLFHPYEPPTLFKRWRVGFLHGAIPKNQPRLAAAIGRTVGNRLLTSEDLTSTFANKEFRDAFDQRLSVFVDEVLNTERDSLSALIPPAVRADVDALIGEAVGKGLEQLDGYLASESFEGAMERRASDLVAAVADQPIGDALTPARGAVVEEAVEDWLRGVVESDDFTTLVADQIERGAEKLLEPGRTFEQVLPLGLVGSVERAIASYLPLAAERLGGLLEDPQARGKFESTINDLLHRFLRDLKFHQRVVARVVMTESTVDKVLDTIEAEGAERLSEILRDPAVQEAMARGVNQAIVDFLRRPVREVLGAPEDETVVQARDTLTEYVVNMAREPDTRAFLVERLHTALESAGDRTWGQVLDRIPMNRIAEVLVTFARTEIARDAIETGASRLVSNVMDRPIGTPARWFPEDGPARLEAALGDPIWDWLQTQVPDVVERIDVARRVEEKVLHFPTARMEEIVRKVTDRELRLIVQLGYVLGAMIGLGLVAVDRLLG